MAAGDKTGGLFHLWIRLRGMAILPKRRATTVEQLKAEKFHPDLRPQFGFPQSQSRRLRVQFRAQVLGELFDLFEFLDDIFRQQAFADARHVGGNGLCGAGQNIGLALHFDQVDAFLDDRLVWPSFRLGIH